MKKTFRRAVSGAALCTAASLVLTGCTGSESEPQTEEKRRPEIVWAGKICEHMSRSGAQLRLPKIDRSRPAQAKQRVVAFLGDLARQLGTLETEMKQEGAPPVEDGRPAFTKAMKGLGEAKRDVAEAAESVRKTEVHDEKSLNAALRKAGEGFRKAGTYQGPAQELRAAPVLERAFAKAPDCAALPAGSTKG